MYQAPMHLKDCATPLKTETWDRMFAPLRQDRDTWWAALKDVELTIRTEVDGELHRLLHAEHEWYFYQFDAYAY